MYTETQIQVLFFLVAAGFCAGFVLGIASTLGYEKKTGIPKYDNPPPPPQSLNGVTPPSNSFKLIHVSSGTVGSFVKEYRPTGGMLTTTIRTENGMLFYAPSVEFKVIN